MTRTAWQSEQFPTLFNDGRVRVFNNPTKEIFVEDIATGVQIRIQSNGQGLEFTTFGGGQVQPIVVTGSIGWKVTK